MATFTLNIDINELTGGDAARVTVVRIRSTHAIANPLTNVVYVPETLVQLVNGAASVTLEAGGELDPVAAGGGHVARVVAVGEPQAGPVGGQPLGTRDAAGDDRQPGCDQVAETARQVNGAERGQPDVRPQERRLRLARVVRYRDDKTPAEADTIDAVRAIAIRDGVVPE